MEKSKTTDKHVNIRFERADYDLIVPLASEDARTVGAWIRHEAIKAAKARQAFQEKTTSEAIALSVAKPDPLRKPKPPVPDLMAALEQSLKPKLNIATNLADEKAIAIPKKKP